MVLAHFCGWWSISLSNMLVCNQVQKLSIIFINWSLQWFVNSLVLFVNVFRSLLWMPSFWLAWLLCRFCRLVLNIFLFKPRWVAAHLVNLVACSWDLFLSFTVENCHVSILVSLFKRICLQWMKFVSHISMLSLAFINRRTACIGSNWRFLGILYLRFNQNTSVLS